MRFAFLFALTLLTGCAQTQPELLGATSSLGEPQKPQTAKAPAAQTGDASAAVWEPVRPALSAYIGCAIGSADKILAQAEDARVLAATAMAACSMEYQRTRARLAQFYGAERAFTFGDEVKSMAREAVVAHINQVRAKARGDDVEKPAATEPEKPAVTAKPSMEPLLASGG